MQTLIFVDLDDTLFQTLPKCPAGEPVRPAALGRDGAPLSFMTRRQCRLFDLLDGMGTLIPVTARNRDAFGRVQLRFRSFAILDFGGVILRPDGSPEPNWDRLIRPQAQACGAELERLRHAIDDYIQAQHLGARARLIADFEMPLYVVVKHPDGDVRGLQEIHDRHLPEILDRDRFFLHLNGNNLSVVPRFLGKEKAVRYLLDTHFAAEPVLTLGLGDSLTDIPYLQHCDFLIVPRGSQLEGKLARDHTEG